MQKINENKLLKNFFASLLLLLMLTIIFFHFFSYKLIKQCYAESNETYFAKVLASNVKLYRTTNGSEEVSNIFFVIPQSYFVEISYCENKNYYTARYHEITGYVKRSEVKCISGIPQTPFATASFRVFIPGGVDLRSSPTQSEGLNSLATINYLETNLKYYGTIDGEEAISHKSTTWYYCKYIRGEEEILGYVYSAYCDLLTTIPQNTETVEYIDEPEFSIETSTPPGETTGDAMSSLPTTTQIIIIIAVCLPCVAIIYLLFKPTKITAKALEDAELNPSKKSKRKKARHQDYYEYDE